MPSPGDPPDAGIEPVSLTSPALVGTFFPRYFLPPGKQWCLKGKNGM